MCDRDFFSDKFNNNLRKLLTSGIFGTIVEMLIMIVRVRVVRATLTCMLEAFAGRAAERVRSTRMEACDVQKRRI